MTKCFISNRCISGLMSNLIKKSWTVSIQRVHPKYFLNMYRKKYFRVDARPQKTSCSLLEKLHLQQRTLLVFPCLGIIMDVDC